MIKHIFKIIWTERKMNSWILLELILVFCILWFCVDYLYFTTKRYFEPKGFDTEHTYIINVSMKDEGRETLASGDEENKQQILDDIWTIYDRIKKYPLIESASYSHASQPYSGSWSSSSIMVDSVEVEFRYKRVTSGYFDVFKIKLESGTIFDWNNVISESPVVISTNRNGLIGGKLAQEIKYLNPDKENKEKVIGVAEKSKRSEYEDYYITLYKPLRKDDLSLSSYREICVRVKPDADKNFAEQFTNDMRGQLEIGPYYLSSVRPIDEYREEYMEWMQFSNNFKSIYSISTFLIINIFLGIVGTFWFRIQSRRSDIGLRIAMGASKKNVRSMFIMETIILLFIASLIATPICINITMADILKDIGIPAINREWTDVEFSQYFIDFAITFIFLTVIATLAIWLPAHKASNIQPAMALRDE
ncbi:MAG: ABC transporter permease [Dysgonomonas sp.]